MSKIKAGDLVMVVRPFCCAKDAEKFKVYGATWLVAGTAKEPWICGLCGYEGDVIVAHSDAPYGNNAYRAPVSILKRIPPLSEIEGETRKETERV